MISLLPSGGVKSYRNYKRRTSPMLKALASNKKSLLPPLNLLNVFERKDHIWVRDPLMSPISSMIPLHICSTNWTFLLSSLLLSLLYTFIYYILYPQYSPSTLLFHPFHSTFMYLLPAVLSSSRKIFLGSLQRIRDIKNPHYNQRLSVRYIYIKERSSYVYTRHPQYHAM